MFTIYMVIKVKIKKYLQKFLQRLDQPLFPDAEKDIIFEEVKFITNDT